MSSKNTTKAKYIPAVGRRKRAVARIRLHTVSSDKDATLTVNDKPIDEYFTTINNSKALYNKPFKLTDTAGKFMVTVKVTGSGLKSQLDAIVHGISRALIKVDESHRSSLKAEGLLTRDPRERQRRMVGTGGKARRKKQSPKR